MQSAVKPMLVANWKSHGDLKANQVWLKHFLVRTIAEDIDLVICPPFPYIPQLLDLCKGTAVTVGGQNISAYGQGAYTGEVAAEMLIDLGCLYVIIGHSERRSLYAEDDKELVEKLRMAIDYGLTPIFCVGETLQQRQSLQTEEVLIQQLSFAVPVLQKIPFVIAYEPIWAIGTGQTATPEQAQKVHSLLRDYLTTRIDEKAVGIRIIYGGSIKPNNAQTLFSERDVDGGLVGGASLNAEDFLRICKALETTKKQIN